MDVHRKGNHGFEHDPERRDSSKCDRIDFAEGWGMLSLGVSVLVIAVCIFLCVNIIKIEIANWVGR